MKSEQVPQDQCPTLAGQRKPIYVLDANGEYTTELSSGWEAEEVVLHQAIDEFKRSAEAALARAQSGQASPLEYHMYNSRMDIMVLAQSTGFFKWQVKRHLRPAVFSRLGDKKIARYAEALGLDASELKSLPKS